MDTARTGLPARGSLARCLAALEIGPEVDVVRTHLMVRAWFRHIPFAPMAFRPYGLSPCGRPRPAVRADRLTGVGQSAPDGLG